MATKEVMSKELIVFLTDFDVELEECKIGRLGFLRWFDKLKTYEEIRKAHQFAMTKLLKHLILITKQLKHFDKDAWIGLKIHAKNQKEVVMLRELCGEAKRCWGERPKPKRRGNE